MKMRALLQELTSERLKEKKKVEVREKPEGLQPRSKGLGYPRGEVAGNGVEQTGGDDEGGARVGIWEGVDQQEGGVEQREDTLRVNERLKTGVELMHQVVRGSREGVLLELIGWDEVTKGVVLRENLLKREEVVKELNRVLQEF